MFLVCFMTPLTRSCDTSTCPANYRTTICTCYTNLIFKYSWIILLELWKRSIEVIWLKPANVPKPRMFVQGGRQKCCRCIQILCSPQIPFMQWNTGWQNNCSPDIFCNSFHKQMFCESKRMQKNSRPQMNKANLLPFGCYSYTQKMFASNVCLPWPPRAK